MKKLIILALVCVVGGCKVVLRDWYEVIYAEHQRDLANTYVVSLKRVSDGAVFNQVLLGFKDGFDVIESNTTSQGNLEELESPFQFNPILIKLNPYQNGIQLQLMSYYEVDFFGRQITWLGFQDTLNLE